MKRSRRRRLAMHHAVAGALAAGVLGLAAVGAASAFGWWGRTFPGFVVIANRVIATASLPAWRVDGAPEMFLAEVVSVDGRRIGAGADVYAQVASYSPGTPFTYALRRGDATWYRQLPSRTFHGGDVALVFGSFLLNGLIFGLVGVAVWMLRPELPAARAMLVFGVLVAVWVLAAVRVYDASPAFLRVHLFAEALLPAATVQLAFVFPTWHRARWHRGAMGAAWSAGVAVGLQWQRVLFDPPRAMAIGNVCYVGFGLALAAFVGRCVAAYRSGSALEQNKIRVVVLSALPAGVFPAALFALSGLTGGQVPVNSAAFTAFLFPLGLGYAIVRHDLFEIDTFVCRLVHWVILTVLAMLLYGAVMLVSAGVLEPEAHSPLLPLHFALGLVVVLLPLYNRVQRTVDRLCFRQGYDAHRVFETVSVALGSTLDVELIAATVMAHLDDALAVEVAALYVADRDGRYEVAGGKGEAWGGAPTMEASHPTVRRLARNRVVAWYANAHAAGGPLRLGRVASEVVVPMVFRERLVGFIALGPRRSGRYYGARDVQFLRTLANHAALSLVHAQAYQELHELTLTLEHKVAERTAELARSNGDLQASVHRVSEAYRELEQSQEKLVRAEKMATLGRLAAGVAHEVSTPLGATLTNLRLARKLVAEYGRSIRDTDVAPEDHDEIAHELDETVGQAEEWTQKAAKFILALKAHTRGYGDAPVSSFDAARVVHETELLLRHRATATGCEVRVAIAPDLPRLRGDPTKLGQVLTNLVTNGIDAYEEAHRAGDIEIDVGGDSETLVVTVTDRGCGIRPEHTARIFEELFTTKPPGRGTGLGLAIVREIVQTHFGGTIEVASVLGNGTTFTVRLPAAAEADAPAAPAV